MSDTNILSALGDRAIEHFRGWAVRVFFEKVMLDLPDIVHTDTIGEFDLRQCLPIGVVLAECVPGARGFHFIQETKFHMTLLSERSPFVYSLQCGEAIRDKYQPILFPAITGVVRACRIIQERSN